jgi:hypothetical protein
MSNIEISQSEQFKIKDLSIVTKAGKFNLGSVFEELNIFDTMLMPCMSGNISIRDAVGLSQKLYFDGSEYIVIDISKSGENLSVTSMKKTFRIYKQTDRKNINQTSEEYILHFVSEEFIYSLQQKINQSFNGLHSDAAEKILKKYLKVSTTPVVEKTKGNNSFIVPLLSPFDSLNWLAIRALNNNNLPDYIFFQNKYGYNFVSLSTIFSKKEIAKINFNPKNISTSTEANDEFNGARDVKVITQFNVAQNIMDGVYAGKFIGFDVLTRKLNVNSIPFYNIYSRGQHLNKYPNVPATKNREGLNVDEMGDSKISLYPFMSTRKNQAYTKTNDNKTATIIDDTDNYVFQRSALLSNLIATRLQVTIPGNFALTSGFNVYLKYPKRSITDNPSEALDKTLEGKYLIVAARHIIRFDRHETLIEIASDSTNRQLVGDTTGSLRVASN